MEQKDLDIIKKFETAKNKTLLQRIGLVFFIALVCCSVYILIDVAVSKEGVVEVTLPYFIGKFSYSLFMISLIYFLSYHDMRRKYKKLKEKE
jgi:hypothetical protein